MGVYRQLDTEQPNFRIASIGWEPNSTEHFLEQWTCTQRIKERNNPEPE
jgi:hypothetical protein